jgi:hypothetical protein
VRYVTATKGERPDEAFSPGKQPMVEFAVRAWSESTFPLSSSRSIRSTLESIGVGVPVCQMEHMYLYWWKRAQAQNTLLDLAIALEPGSQNSYSFFLLCPCLQRCLL